MFIVYSAVIMAELLGEFTWWIQNGTKWLQIFGTS